jgi:hypothetical protein
LESTFTPKLPKTTTTKYIFDYSAKILSEKGFLLSLLFTFSRVQTNYVCSTTEVQKQVSNELFKNLQYNE